MKNLYPYKFLLLNLAKVFMTGVIQRFLFKVSKHSPQKKNINTLDFLKIKCFFCSRHFSGKKEVID